MEQHIELKVKKNIEKGFKIFFKIVFGILFVIAVALVLGYGVMWLWNGLMPDIFGLNTIGYWQAVGILVLAKLFFGGFGGHASRKGGKRSKRHCMSRKGKLPKTDFSKWKHYEKFWEEEGEKAYNAYVEGLKKEEREGQ